MTLWTIARQAPLSMGFFRHEYWSGLPCPPPGNLPDPGIEPRSLMSPALSDRFFTTSATGEAPKTIHIHMYSSRYVNVICICGYTHLFELSLLENNNYKKLCKELKGQRSSRLSSVLLTCIKPLCNTHSFEFDK